jgi:hypothetical protein
MRGDLGGASSAAYLADAIVLSGGVTWPGGAAGNANYRNAVSGNAMAYGWRGQYSEAYCSSWLCRRDHLVAASAAGA